MGVSPRLFLNHLGPTMASLWLLLASLGMSTTLMVEKNAPLSVRRGRISYVHPHDLILSVPDGDLCKVEVIANDPMSQRVGKLHPLVFDCRFSPYTVKYTHNGSPLLDHDQVHVRVHHFAATRTFTRHVTIHIRILDLPFDVFVQDSRLKDVEVPEFFGLSNAIDASVIRFRYNYYDGATCIVSFSQLSSHLPMQGQVVRGVDLQPVETLRHDCRDFLYLGLRYKHLRPPSPRVDYLHLSVEVSDPSHGEESVIEQTYLPIIIKGAYPNMPPRASMVSSYIMEVEQYVLTALDPQIISAEDDETPSDQLVFNISKPLDPGQGFFVHTQDHTLPIKSFVQADLVNHNIAYHPPNTSATTKEVFEVEFTVFDSYFSASQPILLHIAIRPTNTNSPIVTTNKGLRLVEGQSRPITAENLVVVDSDNIDDVRIYVKGGLRHGRLEVNGRSSVMFSVKDLEAGTVIYRHSDSDTSEDKIIFRISDGTHTIRTKFPISILPKDDSPPYLINNVGLTLIEGGQVQILPDILSAHDKDSDDSSITYVIKTYPSGGEIVKKYRPMTRGQAISKFTQLELSRGLIYYHHLGGEIFSDSFEFRLYDDHEPPNKSGKYTVTISIRSVDDMPPQLVPGCTRQLSVYETDIAIITLESLHYIDTESPEHDLLYTVTNQPFFLTTTITIDAGRVISTVNMSRLIKDSNLEAIHVFTQNEINHGRVAYMPPIEDIGPIRRHARFHFTVSDSSGNKVMDQPFDITILPVNNQFPHLSVRPLTVVEGGAVRVSINDISAYDPDTDQDELRFVLDIQPRYGKLLKDEHEMKIGDSFALNDLMRPCIRFVHLGSDEARDKFTLSVSDGINRVTKTVPVEVKLINDHQPKLLRNLRTEIQVKEGEETVITSVNLAATDNDTDDHMLSFVVIKSPQHGEIQIKGRRVSQFTQSDVWNKQVKFVHTSGEIGPNPLRDSSTFAVTDQANSPGIKNTPLLDLNFTIMPVDNQTPYILLGSPLFVNEGQRGAITTEVVNAKDVDTHREKLKVFITKQPQYGFIENITPAKGSEIKNVGKPVAELNAIDLKTGNVRYVQANHSGIEPISDSFDLIVSDGQRESRTATIPISIVPQNDEKPILRLNNLVVGEGNDIVIAPGELTVSDADVPQENLVLSIAKAPAHGRLILLTHAPNEGGLLQLPMQDITLEELQRDMSLVYVHDSSENYQDAFTLKVTDGVHVKRQTATVKVVPLNDEKPHVVKNAGLRVGYGGSGLISSVVLRTVDTDNNPDQIQFQLVQVPEKGALQFLRNPTSSVEGGGFGDAIEWIELKLGQNFSQEDVDMNRVRYVHMAAMDEAGKDSFRFTVSDGTFSTSPETFEIDILSPKMREIAVLNRALQVKEGDSKVISTDVLSASDGSHRPQDMFFQVTRPPTQGHLALITEKNTTIHSFSQLDLAAQKIVYIHTSKADIAEDFFLFEVTNSANQNRSGVFRIIVESLDQELPTLETNMPLTVVQSETATIDFKFLRVTDPDTPTSNLTYIVTEGPTHGEMLVRGKPITGRFTQLDVDEGEVKYRNDGTDDVGMDFFLFMVSDLHHDDYLKNGTVQTKGAFFSILIQPLAKEPPRLINNRRPPNLELLDPGKYGFLISTDDLLCTHPLCDNGGIVYTLLQKPSHGYLENQRNHRPIKKRFTQKDIDDGHVAYVLDDGQTATNDSFTFRVQDNKRNTLDNQRFELEWSVLEFKQSHFIVCEDAGTMGVTVYRRGALNGSAYVDIRTKEKSAKQGLDYSPSEITQLQFDPGVTSVVWEVEIAQDTLEESNEKFRILLRSQVNAILGDHDKATVQIVDYKDGRCDEYIGMISKGQNPVKPVGQHGATDFTEGHLMTEIEDFETTLEEKKPPKDKTFNGKGDVRYFLEDEEDMDDDSDEDDLLPDEIDIFSFGQDDLSPDGKTLKGSKKTLDVLAREDARTYRKDMHPREGKKQKKRRKSSKKKKRKKGSSSMGKLDQHSHEVTTEAPTEQTSPTQTVAPQSCTKETKGLLYFDLKTARMFRCDGQLWERWYHNHLDNKMFKTAPQASEPVSDTSTATKDTVRKTRDSCQEGWERHRDDCYRVLPERLTWNEGEKVCEEQQGGHLSHVESAKHLDWLRKLSKHEPFWIGMNDKRLHHRWEYTHGGPVRFYHWRRGFPRSQRALAKHCVLVAARAEWVNRLCDKNIAKVICVKPIDSLINKKKWRRRRRRRRRWHQTH